MRHIPPLDLVGKDKLDFDLYDDKGQKVYNSGEILTPGLLMKLCSIKIFVNDEKSEANNIKNQKGLKHKPLISEKTTENLVKNAKSMLKRVYNDEKPDEAAFKETTNIIIEEVSKNLEKIDCISQLRIFDEYTYSHTVNVSTMSASIGMILGLAEDEVQELALGALLHDVGKMLVPKEILNKPAKLDPEEFDIMKSHTLLGYRYILEKLNVPDKVARVALDHQEKYGGGGYPNGLKGKEINFYAQITSISDVYDALISNRVYKSGMKSTKAIEIMILDGRKCFNPFILSKFIGITDYKNKPALILDSRD